jgi:hypothetical protein
MTNAVSIDSQIVSRTGKGTRNDDVIEFDVRCVYSTV